MKRAEPEKNVTRCLRPAYVSLLFVLASCSSGADETLLDPSGLGLESNAPLLGFPEDAADAADAPLLLSETGAFAELSTLRAAPGFMPYAVQSPLFSNGAGKSRWLSLPEAGQIGFSEHAEWTFPEGTVFAKHFGMALDETEPAREHRLETRFLVAARGGSYYGLVYKWDEDQAEARLILDGGEEQLEVTAVDGSTHVERYTYPAQSSCGMCHSDAIGYVQGVRTAQLNGEVELPEPDSSDGARSVNQLIAWSDLGLLDREIDPGMLAELPQLAGIEDESASIEHRVRSYWDSNCSMCHNPAAPPRTWDARIETPLAEQGVLFAEPLTGPRPDGTLLVAPGDPEHSLLYLRVASTEPGMRMPPILRNRVDESYVALLERWIVELRP